jgi:hypothetical protein
MLTGCRVESCTLCSLTGETPQTMPESWAAWPGGVLAIFFGPASGMPN